MSGEIFISYRRQESKWSTKSVYDRLSASFGSKRIFMDIDTIALGDDFVKAIEKTVSQCDVLIAVIGAHWLTATDDQGRRRLENPEDLVRRELAAALKRDIRVIPVLVDALLIRWRLIGSQLRSVVYDWLLGEEIYYIDTTQNRKYSVLQINGTPIAGLLKYQQIQPGQQRIAWAKFPAPPAATKKIGIYIQNFLPFEDIPVD
jgi:hypothetical protein